MHDLYYENSARKKLNLSNPPYYLQATDLFDYIWSYEKRFKSNSGYGIKNLVKEISENEVKLTIAAKTEQEYYKIVDTFFDIVNYDVINEQCGKLWFGEYYLKCYIIASKKEDWEEDCAFADETLTIVPEYPFWIRETERHFLQKESAEEDKNTIDYPYDYPYDYIASLTSSEIENNTNNGLEFEIKVFGPCVSPQIIIGGNIYRVNTTLEEGEYLIVNSITRKIYKVLINGEQVNQYGFKDEDYYIFEKIPPGISVVSWDNTFGFDVTVIERRVTPRWS